MSLFLVGTSLLCISVLFVTLILLFAGNNFPGTHLQTLAEQQENNCRRAEISPAVAHLQRPNFQTGIVFPQWSRDGYGQNDTKWQQGIQDIQSQTGARWLEIPVLLAQQTATATTVTQLPTTPSVTSVMQGICKAHALGFRVFLVPLIKVIQATNHWSGYIHFDTIIQAQQWFESYWQIYKPYVMMAQQTGVEQLAISTEDTWLQTHAQASLWNQLIAHIGTAYHGMLTYDMNWTYDTSWSDLGNPVPSWLLNPQLASIGVSTYLPLTNTAARVAPEKIDALWRNSVKIELDNLAVLLHKTVFISEIGYPNNSDALSHPWTADDTPPDPTEQAAACEAAIANVITDPHIAGIFFWGWDEVGGLGLHGLPAVAALHKWYTSLQA